MTNIFNPIIHKTIYNVPLSPVLTVTLSILTFFQEEDPVEDTEQQGLTCSRWGWSASGMASARGTSKGLGGMQPRKVMESERRKKGWF